jgi:hypothetical protein
VNHVACFGDNQGSIDLQISGGTEPYTVNWSHGASGPSIGGLADGAYTAQVIDANGLSAYKVVNLDGPEMPLAITGISSNLSGYNSNDGNIVAQVSGGTPFKSFSAPYIYEWSNGVYGTLVQEELSAGLYAITVTDNNGCTATKQFLLTQTFQLMPLEPQFEVLGGLVVSPNPSTGVFKALSQQMISDAIMVDLRTGQILPLEYSGREVNVDGLASGEYQLVITNEQGKRTTERIQVIR